MNTSIAMKPYYFIDAYKDEDFDYWGYGCPNCKFSLYSTLYDDYPDLTGVPYCPKCGQKLDWSDVFIEGSTLYRIIKEMDNGTN